MYYNSGVIKKVLDQNICNYLTTFWGDFS